MTVVQIEDWALKVDIEQTNQAYREYDFFPTSNEELNFIQQCAKLNEEVIQFAEMLHINLAKPSMLTYHFVEQNEAIFYTGQYYIYGELKQGELDGWDMLVDPFCFSLTNELTIVPFPQTDGLIEISFEVVLKNEC